MQQKRFDRESLISRLGCNCELKALLNSLPGVIGCRRIDDHLSFSFVSAAMHRLTGYRADEVVNGRSRSFESLLHPQESLSKLRQSLLMQLHQKQSYTLQYRLFHRDGSLLWIWESGCKVATNDGEYPTTESILIDISELHQQQRTLETALAVHSRDVARLHQQLTDVESRARHDEVQLTQTSRRLHRQGQAIGHLVSGCADVDTMESLADYLCGQLNSVLAASGCSVWSFEPGKQILTLLAADKGPRQQLQRRLFSKLFASVEAGIPFTTVETGSDRCSSAFNSLLDTRGLRAVMVIPLRLHQQAFGMLLVEQRDIQRHWHADELNFAISASLVMMARVVELEAEGIRERLHSLAYFDSLTQLENRQLFNEQLKDALARIPRDGHSLALLFIDLNNFKQVNDNYGHALGDQLLQQVAGRLKSTLRKTDHIARIGGDEFVALLHSIGDELAVAKVAEKLSTNLVQPYLIEGRELEVGVSIGIALAPKDSHSAEPLMRMADQAMYRAKSSANSHYQFADPTVANDARNEFTLLSELRLALAQNQLELVYLPQVSLSDGQICGAEALLRWRHPRLGLLPPASFIDMADQNNLLKPIGDWVCEQVIADACNLNGKGKDLVFSFNLSSSQMDDAGLVDRLAKRLAKSSLPPRQLRIELKEDALLAYAPEKEALLNRLHQLGIGLTIDNFGAGACALETLSRMPIDLLKIDQHLMRDVEIDPAKRALASTMIALATMLGKRVVAEGIETQRQADFLAEHFCDYAQGFYYYRPMTFATFSRVLH